MPRGRVGTTRAWGHVTVHGHRLLYTPAPRLTGGNRLRALASAWAAGMGEDKARPALRLLHSGLCTVHRERMNLKAPIYFSTGLTEKANHYYKLFITWTNQKIRKTFVQRNMFEFKHIKAFDRAFADNPGPMVRPWQGGEVTAVCVGCSQGVPPRPGPSPAPGDHTSIFPHVRGSVRSPRGVGCAGVCVWGGAGGRR